MELTGRVIYAGESGYEDARLNFNTRFAASPFAIVFCQSVTDVINAVNWAQTSGIPVRVRSGRHSYEAFSVADDALIIDLNDMEKIQVDRSKARATIQAGAELVPIYETLNAQGVTIPGGSCATVGITGLTLGGGYGLLARWKGLTCDNLQSVEMVTAAGKAIVASPSQNPDLFWALRGGGGGNFGIVTSLTYQVHSIDKVTVYQLSWNWSEIERVMQFWQTWAPETDDRHTSILKLVSEAVGSVFVVGQFVGTETELRQVLAPLLTLAPKSVSIETLPYIEAVYAFAGLKPDYPKRLAHWHGSQTKFKNASDYVARPLSAAGTMTVINFLKQAPSKNVVLQFDSYGGAIAKIAPDATAFPHRQVNFNIQYQTYWTKPQDQAVHLNWVRNFRAAMQPHVTGGCYVNYCDRDLKNWQTAYYGNNWQKLKQVKQRVDPGNFFRFEQSVPKQT
ncbi:MAG: FAD-binding oxidoreductase [Plectolyngbya sp. WJT66-NPBG17]|jgi:FAD/FMN-containing dehydrogenase|nr:FAD-binding oxidoreductase [Plectolyngbya sp. WJT66-NPBG17]